MQTLEQALIGLVKKDLISKEESFARAPDRTTLEKLMELEGIDVPAELRAAPKAGTKTGIAS